MLKFIKLLAGQLFNSFLDLAPILTVVLVFQLLVIRQPVPDAAKLVSGTLYVIIGLMLFIRGLELSLFPIGESMAYAFARKGSLPWLLAFAFCLGFSASIAEPAVIAIAEKAADFVNPGKTHSGAQQAKENYAVGLRVTIALSVGFAIMVSVFRIAKGWPVYYPVICAYSAIAVLTPFAPSEIVGIAYDAGGIATSTITVPLVTALGVGLATAIKGRNPMTDGFGLVVLASLIPVIFVMAYGMAA